MMKLNRRLLIKDDRVRLTRNGRHWGLSQALWGSIGTVTSREERAELVSVRWDGHKSFDRYHVSFLARVIDV